MPLASAAIRDIDRVALFAKLNAGMPVRRRRLLLLAVAATALGYAPPAHAQQLPQRLTSDLDPMVASEVLMAATRADALPDGYVPRDLVSALANGIPASGGQLIRALIVDDTRSLVEAAAAEGLELYVGSGFRSQAYQASVFTAQTARWGDEETANRYSARAGHSQHQLGTTIDFTDTFRGFRGSPAALWLSENAQRFGFVLPYTPASAPLTGYVDEPWHARWVGSGLATQLQLLGYQASTSWTADDAIAVARAVIG
jgi:zinc D-Ala-D-Ala carboxypeptidase